MGKFREFFKPKPKEKKQPLPWTYYFFIIVITILLLNFAFLLPPQLSALWFESELLVIQFLKNPITLQTWAFFILFFIIAWVGWYMMPVVDIPSTSESHFYTWRREEGGVVFFRMLNGREMAIDRGALKRRLLRWNVYWPVGRMPQGDIVVYETEELEISSALMWMRYAHAAVEEVARLYAEKEGKETHLTFDQALAIIKARLRGEEE